jgi:hypothetical protein
VIALQISRLERSIGKLILPVYTDRRLMRSKLLALAGVQSHQRGDDELRAVFLPASLPAVAKTIRARTRRSPDRAKHLAGHAYRSTPATALASATMKARPPMPSDRNSGGSPWPARHPRAASGTDGIKGPCSLGETGTDEPSLAGKATGVE